MSDQVSSDGSTGLTLSGQAGRLGRFTGTGTVDKVDFDPLTQRISASGSATWVFSNGDELHLKVSVFFSVKTRIGIEMIQFTGGAGRFTGATGTATVLCRGTVDPNVPSAFTCGGNGSLILILPGH